MAIIAMTREMGTLGKEVARAFAQRMGYTVIHAEVAGHGNERARRGEESEVYRFLEGSQDELDKWRSNRASGGFLTPEQIFEIALEGNVLIRGWGAAKLLRSVPNVLSLRVCAPMDFRIDQMSRRLGIDSALARREIERSDAAHSSVLMHFFGADWIDPLHYDLVLNTGHLTPEACAQILCDTVSGPAFAETEASRKRLTDCLLEARIRSALTSDRRLQHSGPHIQVSVDDARVRLYGLVTESTAPREAADLVSAQLGVQALKNDIAYAGRVD